MAPDLDLTVGALLIGVLITAVGYGITTTQTYMYMTRFPNDPRLIRWTVWSLLVLDTTHIAFTWHMLYHYVIRNFNNTAALEDAVWSFSATIVLTALITTIAHGFYARRIFILGQRKWYLPMVILVLSIVRLVLGFVACAQVLSLKKFELIKTETLPTVVVGLGSGTLADCIITASLVYLLRTHRSDLSPGLNSILDRITYWAVNNGLLTCVVGIAFLVTQFAPLRANMVFIALHVLLSKLYTNSLLATLNSREAQRSGRGIDTAEHNSAIMFSTVVRIPQPGSPPLSDSGCVMFGAGKDVEVAEGARDMPPIMHIASPSESRANARHGYSNVWRSADRPPVRQFGYDWASG